MKFYFNLKNLSKFIDHSTSYVVLSLNVYGTGSKILNSS